MDTDSTPPALLFFGFLLLFSYLSLAEHSGNNGGGTLRGGRPAQRVGSALSSFKYACIIALSIAGVGLALSFQLTGLWSITILSLCLLVVLTIIDRAASFLGQRHPVMSRRYSKPLINLLSFLSGSRTANGGTSSLGNGGANGLPGERLDLSEEPAITEEELENLDGRDREMLRSILQLDVSTAREIMVPRLDMVVVELNSPLGDAVGQVIQSGHSRLPVYDETLDRIVGIVHARDMLLSLSQPEQESSVSSLLRPAFFIPETKRLDELLKELQDKGIQMAMVVDEYGGIEGLVTMEDLLEEIVGEIEDEFSRNTDPEVIHMPDGSVLVDARITTEDVDDLFGTLIDSQDVDTVGGYVYRTLGKMPQAGDIVYTEDLKIEVVSILGRRLRKLRIVRVTDDEASKVS